MGLECVDVVEAERRKGCAGLDPRELEDVRGRTEWWGIEGAKTGVAGKKQRSPSSDRGVSIGGEGERDAGRA
jgi:hypothetical protein